MAEQLSVRCDEPFFHSSPAVSEEEARKCPSYGPLAASDALRSFPDLSVVRAFRKEHCAIRNFEERLRPAQLKGLFNRATTVAA